MDGFMRLPEEEGGEWRRTGKSLRGLHALWCNIRASPPIA